MDYNLKNHCRSWVAWRSTITHAKSPGTVLVGADLVELAPGLDPTGRSSVAAARLVRTLLLLMRELQ